MKLFVSAPQQMNLCMEAPHWQLFPEPQGGTSAVGLQYLNPLPASTGINVGGQTKNYSQWWTKTVVNYWYYCTILNLIWHCCSNTCNRIWNISHLNLISATNLLLWNCFTGGCWYGWWYWWWCEWNNFLIRSIYWASFFIFQTSISTTVVSCSGTFRIVWTEITRHTRTVYVGSASLWLESNWIKVRVGSGWANV